MSDGLLNRLETAQDERDYYKARLAEAERKIADALKTAGGRWCEWGSRAESVRDILQGTTDSADDADYAPVTALTDYPRNEREQP